VPVPRRPPFDCQGPCGAWAAALAAGRTGGGGVEGEGGREGRDGNGGWGQGGRGGEGGASSFGGMEGGRAWTPWKAPAQHAPQPQRQANTEPSTLHECCSPSLCYASPPPPLPPPAGGIRRALFKLERGVCQLCSLDCHALVAQLQQVAKDSPHWLQHRYVHNPWGPVCVVCVHMCWRRRYAG